MKNPEIIKTWNDIIKAKSVAMACHVSPDGDTLGSALALAHVLRQNGIDADVFAQDKVPENYKFLPESDTIKTESKKSYDLGILIDSNSTDRVGNVALYIENAKTTGSIDHHIPNETFGTLRLVNTKAASTAEIIIELLLENNVKIDTIAARQLMTAVVTDTGVFRFSNVTKNTFEYAAILIEAGATVEEVVREVYESRSQGALKLQGYVLSNIQTACGGKIAWAALSKSFLNSLGVSDEETDGVVDHIKKLKGSVVSILIRETSPNVIKVSLRSRDTFDVSRIANSFGGGGHVCASGCTLNMPLEDAEKAVVSEASKWMDL